MHVLNIGLCVGVLAVTGIVQAQSRDYDVHDFERIYFSGTGTLNVIQRNGSGGAQASADAAVLSGLEMESTDGALFIDSKSRSIDVDELVIDVTLSRLVEIVSDGRGVVRLNGLETEDLTLEGKGSGAFQVDSLNVNPGSHFSPWSIHSVSVAICSGASGSAFFGMRSSGSAWLRRMMNSLSAALPGIAVSDSSSASRVSNESLPL